MTLPQTSCVFRLLGKDEVCSSIPKGFAVKTMVRAYVFIMHGVCRDFSVSSESTAQPPPTQSAIRWNLLSGEA